jgi:hypothetical protein
VLYNLLGMKQEAEEQLRRGLAIREKRLGANHMLVAESCNNLGMLLMQANRLNEALAVLRHAAAVIQIQTGPQSAQTIAAWEQLEKLFGRMLQQKRRCRLKTALPKRLRVAFDGARTHNKPDQQRGTAARAALRTQGGVGAQRQPASFCAAPGCVR